jgi:hypothetical protein
VPESAAEAKDTELAGADSCQDRVFLGLADGVGFDGAIEHAFGGVLGGGIDRRR